MSGTFQEESSLVLEGPIWEQIMTGKKGSSSGHSYPGGISTKWGDGPKGQCSRERSHNPSERFQNLSYPWCCPDLERHFFLFSALAKKLWLQLQIVEIFLGKPFQQKMTFSQNPQFTQANLFLPQKILILLENKKWAVLEVPQEHTDSTFLLEEKQES